MKKLSGKFNTTKIDFNEIEDSILFFREKTKPIKFRSERKGKRKHRRSEFNKYVCGDKAFRVLT
ncbi:hypothetical protein DRO61_05485 [Candidatus Bathyarchaeota archaeon]|nr:MAG: hypothetical protein DRO61_05485 [Candidatus Bathyarchaeota archaeon]